ncbi:MAG TPA: hypothetical protein VFQ35_08530, partial [Polyangiaceae bacterium]|nr:hypothetical protein [Polyangiaceae bacterium]
PNPLPNANSNDFASPDPFPSTNPHEFTNVDSSARGDANESPGRELPAPPLPTRALQRTNPNQIRLIWPATLPIMPVPDLDALRNAAQPEPADALVESPWLDAVHVPRLRGSLDTSVRLTWLDRMLTSPRFKPAIITAASVFLLMGISVLFAFALDSDSDDYAPAESELPAKVLPKDSPKAGQAPSKPVNPDKVATPPSTTAAPEHASTSPKSAAGAATPAPPHAPGSPHMATRSTPREGARPRTNNQGARVPWWE